MDAVGFGQKLEIVALIICGHETNGKVLRACSSQLKIFDRITLFDPNKSICDQASESINSGNIVFVLLDDEPKGIKIEDVYFLLRNIAQKKACKCHYVIITADLMNNFRRSKEISAFFREDSFMVLTMPFNCKLLCEHIREKCIAMLTELANLTEREIPQTSK